MKKIFVICVGTIAMLSGCKKDAASIYNNTVKASLSVEFDNIAGSDDLELNTGVYTNASGETFSVSKLKYYVSNFRLTNIDGEEYIVPQDSCYFLIDESDEATHEPVLNVPEGEYRSVSFILGVDSLRNTMDISRRTGVLDPAGLAADMYWDANRGYILYNLEGLSPASPTNNFQYHIGGFGGNSSPVLNNLKTITLDLTTRGTPKVKAGKETNIHLMADVRSIFSGAADISITNNPVVLYDPLSTIVAANYALMFRHDHTEN